MKLIKQLYYLPLCIFVLLLKNKAIIKETEIWCNKINLKIRNNSIFDLIHYPEYRSLIYYRSEQKNLFIRILIKLFSFLYALQKSLFIHTKNIGKGFFIEHGFSTIISAESVGMNFHINQNCTIGWTNAGAPRIGDNVKVGCNSVIIGKINIGSNTIIGAGAVITKTIPNNCVVIGNPARIIKKNGERVNIKL